MPAACRGYDSCPGWFRPENSRSAASNLAPVKIAGARPSKGCAPKKRNRLGDKARLEERPQKLRGVNSMDKPNGRLVLVSYACYHASTSSLSTRWSSWALHFPFGLGDLILERASRLYAFSGYHNRTSLPSCAFGKTTGTQEVRPSRSSRTKDSPLQISYAHSR